MDKIHYQLFRRGSRTYFFSSLFFPRELRRNVFILYGFVRRSDDFVDQMPQDAEGFHQFRQAYRNAWHGSPGGDPVINDYVSLARGENFDPAWTEAFLQAMETDLKKISYLTHEEIARYMYGSAEVVGLMMARLMHLSEAAYPCARALGRAMQYINFIRDIAEDLSLGRCYLPREALHAAGLASLHWNEVSRYPDRFQKLIWGEISRYLTWQAEAEKGYAYLPQRYRAPIQTAADMYRWTAETIHKDPLRVFREKVKPSALRIVGRGLINCAR